ncbi:MAG: ATP-binding protein [Chloroflexota bacterium]|nr:ATP-binding protein [Chloroflexota bacterium]
MDSTAGNGANTGNEGRWAETPLNMPAAETRPSSLVESSQEHTLLAGVAANMRSGFLLLNPKERITYSNTNAQRLLGVGQHALLAEPIFDVRQQLLARAADPDRAKLELDRLWQHPEQEDSTDLALVDAAIHWLRVQCFPIRDTGGGLLGRGVLLDDITLERASAQARGETLGQAAHELKTPLAIIKGCATTLLGTTTRWDPAMQHEMLQMIDTQADRLHEVLNTLLDVWRLDAGTQTLRLAQVNFLELLQHSLERWQKEAPRLRFLLHAPPSIPNLLCDPLRIEQALNHLLGNAIAYSAPGGSVKVQVEASEDALRVSVADEGVGIASEHLDRIFDRFYRIQQPEEKSGGSGLGLAIVRATIEAHGGKIWADSPGPGQGATFYFTLPLAAQVASSREYAQLAPPSGPLAMPLQPTAGAPRRHDQHTHILVAESDTRIARYLRANLEEQGYHVQVVHHGVQFLRQLELAEPDAIILADLADIRAPELLRRLREFSQAPIIMLCDSGDEDEHIRLLDLGADDLLTKPFGMKELLARVRLRLRHRSSHGEQAPAKAIFKTGDLVIDHAQHLVLLRDHPVQLSRTEYKLLSVLAQNVGMVMTHELLLERVWGPEYNREIDFIWVYISRLRRKLEDDPRHPHYILTIPDVGYKLAKLPSPSTEGTVP